MRSQKLTESNRINAKKSTGPRSAAGKAISAQNGLKTGIDAKTIIIKNEDGATYQELAARYYAQFAPATEEERTLVDALVSSEWLRRRYLRVETSIWDSEFKSEEVRPLNEIYRWTDERLARVDRRLNSAIRTYTHVLKQLQQLQSLNSKKPTPPESMSPTGPAAIKALKANSGLVLVSDLAGEPDRQSSPIAA